MGSISWVLMTSVKINLKWLLSWLHIQNINNFNDWYIYWNIILRIYYPCFQINQTFCLTNFISNSIIFQNQISNQFVWWHKKKQSDMLILVKIIVLKSTFQSNDSNFIFNIILISYSTEKCQWVLSKFAMFGDVHL